ncbi:kinase-like domain-containing protein [Suillus cothurnatus]|nr:kinase-like domain-containing protein [Suillus cothurnatus]
MQHHAKQLGGGYLGQGLTKLAIQCKPIGSLSNTNMKDLSDELCLLHKAQYFMDSFYKHALAHSVKGLPSIKWNVAGAFIGKLTDFLLYDVFLATPLLPSGALYWEVKFSGNEQPGNNEDMIGCVVDAYSHHVLVDSDFETLISDIQGVIAPDHSVTLFDPQAHIESQDSGYWDKGPDQIQLFQTLHDCNQFCKALELEQHIPGFKH